LILSNVRYWLEEFRFDGIRIDAAHAIADRSGRHILTEIAGVARAAGAFSIAEDDRNCASLVDSSHGLDALWADDFHHEVRVGMTGCRDSYYSAYSGSPQDIRDTINNGWFFHGQAYGPWNGMRRGTDASSLRPASLVYCIENHDQIGNRAKGERLEHLVSQEQFRAASLLLCLGPHAPLIFMGQDWAASAPFLFFSDHGGEIGRSVSEGRRREHGHTESPDPESAQTFEMSKILWGEAACGIHAMTKSLYRAAFAQRMELRDSGALAAGAWKASSHGDFISIEYRVPLAVRMLVTLLERKDQGFARIYPFERKGRWTVLLNSNWARFGGKLADGDQSLEFPKPGSVWLECPIENHKQ
jgi:maltooligosyltrehalose trehalohydrolase